MSQLASWKYIALGLFRTVIMESPYKNQQGLSVCKVTLKMIFIYLCLPCHSVPSDCCTYAIFSPYLHNSINKQTNIITYYILYYIYHNHWQMYSLYYAIEENHHIFCCRFHKWKLTLGQIEWTITFEEMIEPCLQNGSSNERNHNDLEENKRDAESVLCYIIVSLSDCSVRLTILWCFGCVVRYVVLFPFR